jgi:hypothetical protein
MKNGSNPKSYNRGKDKHKLRHMRAMGYAAVKKKRGGGGRGEK